jgi:hypothetical protein
VNSIGAIYDFEAVHVEYLATSSPHLLHVGVPRPEFDFFHIFMN